MSARLIDDVSGEAFDGPVHIAVVERGVAPRVVEGGLIGLVAIPREVFPALATRAYTIHFTVYAAGYQPLAVAAHIPQQPAVPPPPASPQIGGFPLDFSPVDLGDLGLIR